MGRHALYGIQPLRQDNLVIIAAEVKSLGVAGEVNLGVGKEHLSERTVWSEAQAVVHLFGHHCVWAVLAQLNKGSDSLAICCIWAVGAQCPAVFTALRKPALLMCSHGLSARGESSLHCKERCSTLPSATVTLQSNRIQFEEHDRMIERGLSRWEKKQCSRSMYDIECPLQTATPAAGTLDDVGIKC